MKKIVKRAGLISGIILSAFVIGGCGKTVDLNDCVEVKVSGIDGKGKAEVTVDYDKMETLLAKELNIEVKDKDIENIEDLGSAVDGLSKIDQAENCVNFQVQPADNLKNGDKITVKSIIDEEKAKELGIKFFRPLINDFLRKMAKFRHQENQDVSAGTRIRFFIDKPAAMISFPRAVIKYL